ncbi:hypothetical protein HKBW3S42_00144, partial [Candidatus Hakubella thermalkaliphila]
MVGYQEGLTPRSARPLFIRNPKEVEQQVYNEYRAHNRATCVK